MSFSLNPFEVREVLQVYEVEDSKYTWCLNPFEVREVLQELKKNQQHTAASQSL